MPLDPQIAAMLQSSGASSWPGAAAVPLDMLRGLVRTASMAAGPLDVPLADVRDQTIAGPASAIPVRIYTPIGAGPFPLLVFFHGGGWVVGDLDTQDMIARGLASGAGALVVSAGYRLAPEHRFPAAFEDCETALHWAVEAAASIGGDPGRLAVAGDSAGAVLAAGVAIAARDAGEPAILAQLLFYGAADYPSEQTDSAREYAAGPLLTAKDSAFYWSQYLADPAVEQHDWRASPARARSHIGLPPAFVATAECDPSRDGAERYGALLAQAGVMVDQRRYSGMPHGFVSWLGRVPAAQQAIDDACAFLAGTWERSPAVAGASIGETL